MGEGVHGRTCGLPGSLDRRAFLATLAAGTMAVLDACRSTTRVAHSVSTVPSSTTTSSSAPIGRDIPLPPPHPGPPTLVREGPAGLDQVALTVDDGSCEECVAGYVDFAQRSGMQLSFCPNGKWGTWDRYADKLRPLIEAGQVQIANHTWSHLDLRRLSDSTVRTEIDRNEEWISQTFGVTARPWLRPPFGARNHRTDALAAQLGYTRVLLWNGTLGDATPISAQELLGLANRWVRAGAIVLGHANHPTVLGLFDQLQTLMIVRGLRPVTLDVMFGTSRAVG